MREKQIPGAASAWSSPLQTLREAGGSWAHIWGAESLWELQALRQEWAEGAEPPVPTPRFSWEIKPRPRYSHQDQQLPAQSLTAPRSCSAPEFGVEIP